MINLLMLAQKEPPHINPIAIQIGKLDIRWYAIILTSAMLVALFVLYKLAKKRNFTGDFILEVFLWTIPLSIIAARLGYCAPRTEYWTSWEGFTRVFKIWEGGLTILSGIFGGLLGIFIACKHKKVALFDVVDLVIPALLIGQAIGRWGNFMNEELYGLPVTDPNLQWMPFAVYIHLENLIPGMGLEPGWYAANFFYESVMNLVFGIFVMLLVRRGKGKPGEITFLYMFWYGFLRGTLEFIKIGQYKLGGVIGGAQIFAYVMSVVGLIIFILVKTGKVKFNSSRDLRVKKRIEYVVNDAFIPGTFNDAFDELDKEDLKKKEEMRERRK